MFGESSDYDLLVIGSGPGGQRAADTRGRLAVDEHYRTAVPGIYAVGHMIGFPALAPISMEQGRLVTYPVFGAKTQSVPERFPYDIYVIPEISRDNPANGITVAGR